MTEHEIDAETLREAYARDDVREMVRREIARELGSPDYESAIRDLTLAAKAEYHTMSNDEIAQRVQDDVTRRVVGKVSDYVRSYERVAEGNPTRDDLQDFASAIGKKLAAQQAPRPQVRPAPEKTTDDHLQDFASIKDPGARQEALRRAIASDPARFVANYQGPSRRTQAVRQAEINGKARESAGMRSDGSVDQHSLRDMIDEMRGRRR